MDPQGRRSGFREWIDPTRIYNTTVPAGRLAFLWGLAIYPVVVMFLLLSVVIMVMESVSTSPNVGDEIGIVTWVFMLAWVWATVSICLRRLRYLEKPQSWVWLAILPIVNLIFFLYLLFKPDSAAGPPSV